MSIVIFPHSSLEFTGEGELRTWLIDDSAEGLLSKSRDGIYKIRYKPKTSHACKLVKQAWRDNIPGRFPPPVGLIPSKSIVIFSFQNELVGDAIVERTGFNVDNLTYPFWVKFYPKSVRIYPNRAIKARLFKKLTGLMMPRQEYPRLNEIQYRRILDRITETMKENLKSFEKGEHLKSYSKR